MRRTAARHLAVLALVPVLVAAGACSGDDSASTTTVQRSSGERSSTTVDGGRAAKIGRQVVSKATIAGVDADMQACVGTAFIAAFGADAEQVATTADRKSGDLTPAQLQVLSKTLDRCIPGDVFAEFYLSAIYDQAGLGKPGATATSCLAKAVDGKVGQVFTAYSGQAKPPADFLAALDTCVPSDVTKGIIAKAVSAAGSGGTSLTTSQVDCVVAAVAPKMKISDLAKGDTQQLQSLLQGAVATCPR
jgi:hypothetical protein